MASTSMTQFRNAQSPSKVLHLRNLPWECTEEEILELCKPFGDIANTMSNVGSNRNQAFVEFAELNQAIQMIAYYASSLEPAKIRGRTVYLQYSNRQEIINNKSSGVSGNVLLVAFEGVEGGDISIDVLHLVFSAFGFVHKIATFEKAAGFQALIQFSDSNTASSAKQALDGRSIPRYLLPQHVGPCNLHITFSSYNDLNVRFQSHRSRDYTNPYLPVSTTAMDANGQIVAAAAGLNGRETESNVLLVSVENMQYSISIDVIHTVFSAFGTVQKIAMFEKNSGLQALIQYPDIPTAVMAKEALEGHCIYDGGFCKLHLTFSRHTDLNIKINNDWNRDYSGMRGVGGGGQLATLQTQPAEPPSLLGRQPMPCSVLGHQPPSLPSHNNTNTIDNASLLGHHHSALRGYPLMDMNNNNNNNNMPPPSAGLLAYGGGGNPYFGTPQPPQPQLPPPQTTLGSSRYGPQYGSSHVVHPNQWPNPNPVYGLFPAGGAMPPPPLFEGSSGPPPPLNPAFVR